MANFAVINNGEVVNAIIADDLPTAIRVTGKLCIEYDLEVGGIGIGWTYKDGLLLPPLPSTPTSTDAIITINSEAQAPSMQALEALDNVTGGY